MENSMGILIQKNEEDGLDNCPKCGAEYLTKDHHLVKCPTCEEMCSTGCCMIFGEDEECVECRERSEQLDLEDDFYTGEDFDTDDKEI